MARRSPRLKDQSMQQLSKNPIANAIMLEALKRPAIDYTTATPAIVREALASGHLAWNEPKPTIADVADLAIPGPRGPVPVRVYRPRPANHVTTPQSAIVFAHGGGWAAGSLDTHDRACRLIALHSGQPLIAVDYGLSPEVPFPGGRDDVRAVITHLAAGHFGGDIATDAYALCGDSSGAHVVLVAALAERDAGNSAQNRAVSLIYPALMNAFDSASHQAFGGGAYGLSTVRVQKFWQWHVGSLPAEIAAQADLRNFNLAGLPPLHIVAAGLDCIRDDALALALRLTAAGQRYILDHVEEVPHGFLNFSRDLPESEAMIARVAAFLGRHLAA
jgi:acetyl esterase